ncbi:hypothetical protein FOCC_FOCC012375 [Frankliniella occidentalis]|nr:hypothetical protein FOCC_FOCC012375 [Frankliniella occidentalis]
MDDEIDYDEEAAELFMLAMFFDDDDRFQFNERSRIWVDIESWRRLGDPQFEKHFRMDTSLFEVLLVAIGHHLEINDRWQRSSQKGLDIALLMVLWILATPDSFRAVGVIFEVAEGTVHFHFKYIIEALREMAVYYIQWPGELEQESIAAAFEEMYGYPGVVGCIDGCHINVTAPLEQKQRYFDRKHNYSILLQGVCDHRLVFRDVSVGQPGSVGDKQTFSRSPLGQNIFRDPTIVFDNHLLGDGGYTLTDKVLIPYRDNGNLTRCQKVHNYYLSRSRSCVERAFGLLKGKWRWLKYFHNYCIDYLVDSIMACTVLHNFIILEGDIVEVSGS